MTYFLIGREQEMVKQVKDMILSHLEISINIMLHLLIHIKRIREILKEHH